MASRPSWEGFLTFNLVSIPVKAYSAAAGGGGKIGFHLLHANCNQRIRYKKVCPVHGEVPNEEIVSGYEYAKGEYVTVPAAERSKLRDRDDKTIAIDTFVPPDAIDPVYFSGRAYYLVPSGPAAQKPYAVLMEAMAAHDRHAVAQVVFSGRGQVAVIRPLGRVLLMSLLSYESQVKPPDAFADEVGEAAVSAEERRLASALLESATTGEFDLGRYKDDYAARLAKLIEKKSHGASRRTKAEEGAPPVMDLMEALRKSLSREKGRARRRPVRASKARPARRRKPTRAARWRKSAR
jgi:DNA end-binding protein Ku